MVQYMNTDNNEKTVIQTPVSFNLKGMLMEFKKEPWERQIRSSWMNWHFEKYTIASKNAAWSYFILLGLLFGLIRSGS